MINIQHVITKQIEKNVTRNAHDSVYRQKGWDFFRNGGNEAHLWAGPQWKEMEVMVELSAASMQKIREAAEKDASALFEDLNTAGC